MIKWILYVMWMIILLTFVNNAVVFPSVEIEKLFVIVFVLGSGVITAIIKLPKIEGSENDI